MTYFRFENISKTYPNGVTALNKFNLAVEKGEFISVIGPSGCGKSTLLKLAAGLEDVTSGNIFLEEKNVTAMPPARRNVAMMFQNYVLFPHINIYQNISFGLRLRKTPDSEIKSRVGEIARLLDIENLFERYPHQVSGGQRQRAALARAVLRNPELFLLDEPLSNIDTALRNSMRKEIKKIHARLDSAFLYVTHDQTEALSMGDRVVVLDKGIIQQIDTPRNIYNSPANIFVAEFMGTTKINLLRGKIMEDSETPYFAAESLKIKLSAEMFDRLKKESEVILGIRPENFTLMKENDSGKEDVLSGTLVEVENMGWQSCLSITSEGHALTLTADNSHKFQAGQKIFYSINTESLFFFDKAGKRINS